MKLSIIIVSWNVKEKLRDNLKALLESAVDFSFAVYVVDNNSEDGSAEMVKKEFKDVYLIENSVNFGFAKANNQVIRQMDSDYVLLLNPDMLVKKDTLKKMVGWMEANRQASAAGCRLRGRDSETIKHVRRFPRLRDQAAIILKLPHFFSGILDKYIIKDFDYGRASKVDTVRGGFLMISLSRIKEHKMFLDRTLPELDERFFLWFEEVDYCRQIYRAGGEVWYTPEAECIDYVGQSFKKLPRRQAQRYFQDSMLKYFLKWHGFYAYALLRALWMLGKFLAFAGEKLGYKKTVKT